MLRWAWLLVAVLTLAGTAWMNRYEQIRSTDPDKPGHGEFKWDRWLHRSCFVAWGGQLKTQIWRCP